MILTGYESHPVDRVFISQRADKESTHGYVNVYTMRCNVLAVCVTSVYFCVKKFSVKHLERARQRSHIGSSVINVT